MKVILNAEELQLAALFEKKERIAFMQEIVRNEIMETDIRPVAMSLVDKLARMTDREFNEMEFAIEQEA